jgi:hypothetical protein
MKAYTTESCPTTRVTAGSGPQLVAVAVTTAATAPTSGAAVDTPRETRRAPDPRRRVGRRGRAGDAIGTPPAELSIRAKGTSTPNASRSPRSRAVTPPSTGAAASATPGTALSNVKPMPVATRPRRAPSTTANRVPSTATPATSLIFPVHHPGNRCFRTWSLTASTTTQPRNAGRPSHRQRPPKSCAIPNEPPHSLSSTWTV